ncbi:MAG: hypothetical protein ACRD50_04090 [Candidatus Acidiferrales bacterium]
MKNKLSVVALALTLLASLGLSVRAQQTKSSSWTGWISDSICGVRGANAAHRTCAIECIRDRGAAWVFVNTSDKKILAIENQDGVKQEKDLGHEVTVSGHLTADGQLHVDAIAVSDN